MRKHQYSEAEVAQILRASEGRASNFGRGSAGHSYGRHVDKSNADMDARADAKEPDRNNIARLDTCFVSSGDQIRAVTAALNSTEGQGALADLDRRGDGGRVTIETTVMPPVGVRYTSGTDTNRTIKPSEQQTGTKVKLVLDAFPGDQIHIQSCFPLLWFSTGRPSWTAA